MRLRKRHRRSRMKWVCAVSAPWALGIGLLISLTAEAGNTLQTGVSLLAREHMAQVTGGVAFDQTDIVLRREADNLLFAGRSSIINANLPLDGQAEDTGFEAPKSDLKQDHTSFPEVNRAAKANAASTVPVSLSRRAVDIRNASVYGSLTFARDEYILPPTIVMEGKLDDAPGGLEVFRHDDEAEEEAIYAVASYAQSLVATSAGSTGSGITVAMGDGSTPAVPAAVAMSSATPAPIDEMPEEIAAAPVSFFGLSGEVDDRIPPNYTALVAATSWESEKKCLAEAVYFEARSESPEGQAAVAQVVLNRVKSGLYPKTICGVVYQNRHRHLACQFTFACEGKALITNESESWTQAKRVADSVLEGKTYLTDVGGATHYHADYVKPYWAKSLKRMDVIGRHIFYKLKPGQT